MTTSKTVDIPMRKPDRSLPTTKTLLEIAEERNLLKAKGQKSSEPLTSLDRDAQGHILLPPRNGSISSSKIPSTSSDSWHYYIEAFLLTVTFSTLHFTLDLLVHNQYSSTRPEIRPLLVSTVKSFPILFLYILLLKHPAFISRWKYFKQILCFIQGCLAGCWIIHSSNKDGYMDVMKKAPSLGTIWVYSVVEMDMWWALACLGICTSYLLKNGYTIF